MSVEERQQAVTAMAVVSQVVVAGRSGRSADAVAD
jgi:hypothetical protein